MSPISFLGLAHLTYFVDSGLMRCAGPRPPQGGPGGNLECTGIKVLHLIVSSVMQSDLDGEWGGHSLEELT